MQLLPSQTNETSLRHLGMEAIQLVSFLDFKGLADQFGYSLAFDRDPSEAIKTDYEASIAEIKASPVTTGQAARSVTVKYFSPNTSNLFAVVECFAPILGASGILLELIITTKGQMKFISLEQISNLTVSAQL